MGKINIVIKLNQQYIMNIKNFRANLKLHFYNFLFKCALKMWP